MSVYILRQPEFPWGDYGAILVSGMTAHLGREDGLLQLERTGPFVPPLFMPGVGDIVVTEQFKAQMEASGLTGFLFRPVIKKHIVHLQWDEWDKKAPEPAVYPQTGEPEDYILLEPHSPSLAYNMESLWEVVLGQSASVERIQVGSHSWDVSIHLVLSSWGGADLFKAKGAGYNYVSARARQWLEKRVPEWVRFEEALTDSQIEECPSWTPHPSLDDELRELAWLSRMLVTWSPDAKRIWHRKDFDDSTFSIAFDDK
jgi:hypothetical protein